MDAAFDEAMSVLAEALEQDDVLLQSFINNPSQTFVAVTGCPLPAGYEMRVQKTADGGFMMGLAKLAA